MPVTPMMQQYLTTKEQYKDAILFFRLGDFYEMFYDDAKLVSKELELTLTGRDCGEEERAPMCGIPFHSADTYIARLIQRGYKVAICEQLEDPALAKGLVKRDITRIVTPGTVIEGSMLNETKNNYIAAIYSEADDIGVAFADISTGELNVTSFSSSNSQARLLNELGTYQPAEILMNVNCGDLPKLDAYFTDRLHSIVNYNRGEYFDLSKSRLLLNTKFPDVREERPAVICAVGALVSYIAETQKNDTLRISSLNIYADGQYLELDLNTRRNLELCETMRSKEKKGSLLWVLDRTKTSMGARLLRRWIELPLVNMNAILHRQSAVEELFGSFMLREELAELLKDINDLERLMTRIIYGTANAKDLRAVANTLKQLPFIKSLLKDTVSGGLTDLNNRLNDLSELCAYIDGAVNDDPPFSVREGGFIKNGFSPEVDELRDIINGGKGIIEKLEANEKEQTGIKNLKIGYNRVFGYYIEVTKSNLHEVPPHYIRKQTLANCERFITDQLKQHESTVLGASDRLVALEYDLLCEIRTKVSGYSAVISNTAGALAELDAFVSLADVAAKNNYIKPEIEYGDTISIKEGRHPVVEQFVRDSYFVPNDTLLDTRYNRLILLTGPNMAGKSTYMRQVALITLMAQVGSFVPAKEAVIGIVDKIFTRVGASDDLASGQSTFMLEMSEVAYILSHATKRSLIIYDEIGRGTSTFDGMSIARAIAEYTLGRKLGAKTLFATHYHELTSLEGEYEGVQNYNIAAKKRGDDITFLRKIIRGSADDSYGIEVAKLAGVPGEVTKRAKEILKSLEEGNVNVSSSSKTKQEESDNFSFDDYKALELADRLKKLDMDTITPLEALNLLYELKKSVE